MKAMSRGSATAGMLLLSFFGGIGHAQEEMAVPGIKYGSPETFAEFHGFVTLTYLDFEKDGMRSGDSTFDQHYFYFNAIAKVRPNVTAFGEIEYEHGGEEFSLDRAFIDWALHGKHLNLRLGKFYSPFGLELREYQYPVRKMTSRPLMARNLLFNEWTEVGVNAYGRLGTETFAVNYDLAIVNGPSDDGILDVGTGDNPNTGGTGDARQNRDNNNSRTVVGRVSVPVRHGPHFVEVGVSYGGGRYSDTGAPEDLDFALTGVDARFQMAGIDLRGEYVQRTADVIGDEEIDSNSYYIQASYKHSVGQEGLNYIEPVVRYDFLEPDDDADDDERTRTTMGINYSPYPHFKLMAEWQMNSEEGTEEDDDGFMVSVTVDF